MHRPKINIHGTMLALSSALDFVGIDEVSHGKRVAMMARQIAMKLGWPDEECYSILVAGLLHDCGVSESREHRKLTATLEWEGAEEHCIRGANYLSGCKLFAHFAPEIRHHHTRWERLQGLPLENRIRRRANLLYLADRVDVLLLPLLGGQDFLLGCPDIVARIQILAGSLFEPRLVEAFAAVAQVDAFWLSLEPEYLNEDLFRLGVDRDTALLEYSELKEIARLFSIVVDAKSPYTKEHSMRVGLLARCLAENFGFRADDLEEIEVAGFLHDIGKLRLSEDIIEKPGKLTPEERACIHRHSYDTYRILQRVFVDGRIPIWAGLHHENLLGEGYPFRTTGLELDIVTRIISVADIFQALAQDRPYRKGYSLEEILNDLRERVKIGEVDGTVVEELARKGSEYHALATGK